MNCDARLPFDARSPILVGGQRRSGTTLFRIMLDRHPHISCGRETHLASKLEKWHGRLAAGWSETIRRYGLDVEVLDRSVAAFVDCLLTRYQLSQGKRRWAEKTPGNMLHIDYLFRLFPKAQFIHMIRDPRDTYCSMRNRARVDRPKWSKYTPAWSATEWCTMIKTGKRWRAHPDRYTEVRYEDFVREPAATLQRVLLFLNEPWDPRVLVPGAEGQGGQPENSRIFTTSIGRWQTELTPAEVREIESRATELMVELGYPPTTS